MALTLRELSLRIRRTISFLPHPQSLPIVVKEWSKTRGLCQFFGHRCPDNQIKLEKKMMQTGLRTTGYFTGSCSFNVTTSHSPGGRRGAGTTTFWIVCPENWALSTQGVLPPSPSYLCPTLYPLSVWQY